MADAEFSDLFPGVEPNSEPPTETQKPPKKTRAELKEEKVKEHMAQRPDYLINGDLLDSRNWKLYKVNLWALGQWAPPPPYTDGCKVYSKTPVRTNKFALVSSFNYDIWGGTYDELQLGVNKSIPLPSGYIDTKSLNIEMPNDAYNTVNNYLSYYKQILFPAPNLVRPYRDCCTGVEFLLYDKFMGKPGGYKTSVIQNETQPLVFKFAILPTLGSYSLGSDGTNNVTIEWKIMGVIP